MGLADSGRGSVRMSPFGKQEKTPVGTVEIALKDGPRAGRARRR